MLNVIKSNENQSTDTYAIVIIKYISKMSVMKTKTRHRESAN